MAIQNNFRFVLTCEAFDFHEIILRISDFILHGYNPAGTEYTEIGKHICIFYTGIKRMYTTHG